MPRCKLSALNVWLAYKLLSFGLDLPSLLAGTHIKNKAIEEKIPAKVNSSVLSEFSA